MRARRRMFIGLITMALLLTAAPGAAAENTATLEPRGLPLGPDFLISGVLATGDDWQPAAAWNQTADEYLVVWMDRRYASTRGTDIAGQRVSGAGASLGLNLPVSGPAATGSESLPAIAWNATDNEYLVVFTDNRNWSSRGVDIVGQRLSASGERLRGNFLISGPGATQEEAQPSVAWNPGRNEYLVVWEDRRNQSASGSDIYGQRLSATGARLGDDFRLSGPVATSNEQDAAVVWNPRRDEYLVVWADQRADRTRGLDIYGQRVTMDGQRRGGNFRVSGAGAIEDDTEPMVAWNADANQYLVVWQDARNGGHTSSDIYGQRMTARGKRGGDDFRISGLTYSVGGLLPVVAWNAKTNRYLVVWQDRRNESTSGYDIYGQELSSRGVLRGGNFRISGPGATGHEGAPGIVYNERLNEYLVVWQDARNPSRGYDIWGRRVSG